MISDARQRRVVAELEGLTSPVLACAFAADSQRLATGAADGTVILWDVPRGILVTELAGPTAPVMAIAWTPKERVVCVTKEGDLVLLDESRTRVERDVARVEGSFARLRTSGDGSLVLMELEDGGVRAIELASGRRREALDIDGHLCLAGPSPIVGLRRDARGLYLWDVLDRREIVRLAGTLDDVRSAARSPRGDLVAAGDLRGDVVVWSASDGQAITRLHAHGSRIFTLAFDPEGTRLATGANEPTPRVFDVRTGERRIALAGHDDYVKCVLFTATGQLVSASGDGTLRAWRRAPQPALDR